MIYKLLDLGSETGVEIESWHEGGSIHCHFRQGIEDQDFCDKEHILNIELSEESCQELIKGLKLALKDFKKNKTTQF
jgi:hypothetical protein